MIEIPGRPGRDEPTARVVCADMFKDAVLAASGDLTVLRNKTAATVKSFLDSARPVRERKPRNLAYPGEAER